jgi:hypothetical protein
MTFAVFVATPVLMRTDSRRFVVDVLVTDVPDRAGYESM